MLKFLSCLRDNKTSIKYCFDMHNIDDYLNVNNEDRYNRSLLFNQNIIFRDMSDGQVKEIPVASLIKTKNSLLLFLSSLRSEDNLIANSSGFLIS